MLQLSFQGRARRSRHAVAERVPPGRRRADRRRGSAQCPASPRSRSGCLSRARDERPAAGTGGRRSRASESGGAPGRAGAHHQGRVVRSHRCRAGRHARLRCGGRCRPGSDDPSIWLEGTSSHAARHGRRVAPHPPGPPLQTHPARGARRHPRSGPVREGAVVRRGRGRRLARDRRGNADDRRAYLAQLEAPVIRPPRDPGLLDAWAAGRSRFDEIGCSGCHVPTLELDDPKLDARQPAEADQAAFIVDVAKDGDGPKIEPKYGGYVTSYLVHLFSDLKRHDMGDALATPAPQGTIPVRVFLTRPLWGLAETAPYLHDGRAPTVHDAIVLHGGEATKARDAYLALDEPARASVRIFLTSLSREPKLFVP